MFEVPGARDTARSITSTIRRSRNRFFRWSDFSGTRSAIEKALSRLVDRRELSRVRGGLYWKGSETPFGMSPPNPREVVAAYADGSPTGPAGLSAANFLGLTTQVPRVPEYAAPSFVPDVDRISIRRRSGRRAEARRKARLGEAEVAFLEVLDAWESVVELPPREAIERLLVTLRSGDVDISKVVRAANHEPARSRVRLRAMLELYGMAELVDEIRPASAPSVRAAALEPLSLAVT